MSDEKAINKLLNDYMLTKWGFIYHSAVRIRYLHQPVDTLYFNPLYWKRRQTEEFTNDLHFNDFLTWKYFFSHTF